MFGLGLVGTMGTVGGRGSAAAVETVTTYVSDDFAGGSTVALAGWVPDVGNPWVMNSAGPSTGQVDGVNTRATASVASGHYGVNPTAPATPNYEVAGVLKNISGDNLPGLLIRFSDTVLTGYRVYHQTTTLSGFYFQRLVGGTATPIKTVPNLGTFGTANHPCRVATYTMADRVRLRLIDEVTKEVAIADDFNVSGNILATGYGGVGMRLNSSVGGLFTVKSLLTPSVHTIINADGARTWYNRPALVDGAYMFVGSVSSLGTVRGTKTNGTVHSTTPLSAVGLQVDDHDDASPLKLSNGKSVWFYDKHQADDLIRYRVSTNALPDISAFAAEKTITDAGTVAYTLPFRFTDGYVRNFYRQGNTTTRPRKMAKTLEADLIAGTEVWALSTIFQTTGERPYMVACQAIANDDVHFSMTNGHPQEVPTSLYHGKMAAAAGSETFAKSDGTVLTLPIDVAASLTLVDNTTGGRVWNDKIIIGPDGHPRMLFTKYPTGTTTANAMYTDAEYWHARFDGTDWSHKTRLLTGQATLYSAQPYYVGGMDFDGNDVTKIYAAKLVNGIYEIVLLSINESTGVVTQIAQITRNSICHNIRPQSPAGGSRPFAVTWLHGRYTAYTDFDLEMRAA